MRREHREQLKKLGKYDTPSYYIIKCGDHGARKKEHTVEFVRGMVFFHGHGSISSPTALMQEASMRGVEAFYGCAFLADLLLRVQDPTKYHSRAGLRNARRSSEMVEAEKRGLPAGILLELELVAVRRRQHSNAMRTWSNKRGMFGITEMGNFPESITTRARAAVVSRNDRDHSKIARVAKRLREKGVKLEGYY